MRDEFLRHVYVHVFAQSDEGLWVCLPFEQQYVIQTYMYYTKEEEDLLKGPPLGGHFASPPPCTSMYPNIFRLCGDRSFGALSSNFQWVCVYCGGSGVARNSTRLAISFFIFWSLRKAVPILCTAFSVRRQTFAAWTRCLRFRSWFFKYETLK